MKPEIKMNTKTVLDSITTSLDDNKASNIIKINLNPYYGYDVYFIIASAGSSTHLKKISKDVHTTVKENYSFSSKTPQDQDYQSGWVIIDAGDIIVHLFLEETRNFYKLEELWKKGLIE